MKRNIVYDFKERGCYARRIEDSFSVGFPDLILEIPDYPVFFVEGKLFVGNVFGPTPRQYVELKRLAITKYSHPAVIGWKDGRHYLHPHAQICYVDDCVMQRVDEHIVDFFKRYYNERQQESS